jgi:outer membrane protein OmpA-like peptidoglycan-associated protein
MRRNILVIVCTVMVVLFFAAPSPADLIVMKNGDKLFGKIQNRQFALNSPYGQIVCSYDFLRMISFDERTPAYGLLQTINNDRFSGSILVDEFEIILEDAEHRSISKQHIRKVRIETRGPSYNIATAIISMRNGDKFSGNMITEDFKVKAGYMVKLIQSDTISRIEMPSSGQGNVKILLNNGDLISGELLVEHLEVDADAIGRLTIGKSAISSIQFNASKMVLSQFSATGANLSKGSKSLDQDSDGILDNINQNPNTQQGILVDARGNSKIKTVFFDFDRYNLQHKFYTDLDTVVSMLIQDPAKKIKIQGHTDNIGTPEYNMNLSEKRAGEVKGYLVSKGINTVRISTIGYGYTKNAASNNTTSGRAQNRRAEIILLE